MKLSPEEALIEKRFKKDGFTVKKVDLTDKYKAPDFLIKKPNPIALCEVKQALRKGKVLQKLSSGLEQLDPEYAVYEIFAEASTQYSEFVNNNPEYRSLPFILICTAPFFIDDDLEWKKEPYKKYPLISAVFIPKDTNPLDDKAKNMTLDELRVVIESTRFQSQTRHEWIVIKNTFAKHPLNIAYFSNITMIKHNRS